MPMSEVTVEVEPESSDDSPDVVVVDTGDSGTDETAIDHEGRITRIEDTLVVIGEGMQSLSERLDALAVTDEIQEMEIREVAEEVEEVATEAADAVEEVVEEVDEASPEITPDEVPAVREHFFFRKWGRR